MKKTHVITTRVGMMLTAVFAGAVVLTAPMYTHAQTSGLTDDQINSIIDLLESFDASSDAVEGVENVLRGTTEETEDEDGQEGDEEEQEDQEEEESDDNRSGRSNSGSGAGFLPEQASDRAKEVMQCLQPKRTLGVGSIGQDVENVQNFLKQKGHFDYTEATGYFGPITQEAVQEFQESQGIVDEGTPETTGFGLVGPRTRGALEQATCLSEGQGNSGNVGDDEEEESEDEEELEVIGEVDSVATSTVAVAGETYRITEDTEFSDGLEGLDDLSEGDMVKVEYEMDGEDRVAREIEREDEDETEENDDDDTATSTDES